MTSGPLNVDSRVGSKDPGLLISLLLESLEGTENWDEVLRCCNTLLARAEEQANDRLWSLWLKARTHAKDQE
jgi:hypothetical protein